MILVYLMVLEEASVNFAIVGKLVIPRTILKNVKKSLSHIPFTKDLKKRNFVLGLVIEKLIQLLEKQEKPVW
ncbi:Uncharacterised protein [Chlamydia trachomatis]|nr:Uncharacterised protein [Chlamydia trachomatis]